jgi:guanine deaminase
VRVLGSYGNQLLGWLQNWIFPEVLTYHDCAYARVAANHFFDALRHPLAPPAARIRGVFEGV